MGFFALKSVFASTLLTLMNIRLASCEVMKTWPRASDNKNHNEENATIVNKRNIDATIRQLS